LNIVRRLERRTGILTAWRGLSGAIFAELTSILARRFQDIADGWKV
jgi:hypothetical protein